MYISCRRASAHFVHAESRVQKCHKYARVAGPRVYICVRVRVEKLLLP